MPDTPAVRLIPAPEDEPAPADSVTQLRDHAAAGRPKSLATAVEPLLVAAPEAARLCGVSRSQWWKLHSAGKVPMPVYLGSKNPRWRVQELRSWLAAGAPDRSTWQRLRGAQS